MLFVLVALCLVSIPAASALSQIFSQTFPTQTLPIQIMNSQCTSLNLNSTVTGISGNLLYDCFGSNQQLFAWYATSNGSVIPFFSLASPYTALYLVTSASQCPSQGTPTGTLVTNGTAFSVNTKSVGGLDVADYCLSYSGTFGQTLPGFSITMKQ
jgi:hypothetical protein